MSKSVVNFVASWYREKGTVPTISEILIGVPLTRVAFYTLFPHGLSEVCRLAGVPEPAGRIAATEHAVSARIARSISQNESKGNNNRIVLSDSQTLRVLAISHLERGLAPEVILDRLLDLDTTMRRDYSLTLVEVKQGNDFAKAGLALGYQSKGLILVAKQAGESGITQLDKQSATWLVSALLGLRERNWEPTELATCLTQLYNSGFLQLTPYDARYLIEWFSWAKETLGGSRCFVRYLRAYSKTIGSFTKYLKGDLDVEGFLKSVKECELQPG